MTLIEEHSEWKSVTALSTIEKVICRTSNRVFVGLPLCTLPARFFFPRSLITAIVQGRDPDWIDLNIRCTMDAIKGGIVIGLFPKFVRRYVAAPSLSFVRLTTVTDWLLVLQTSIGASYVV